MSLDELFASESQKAREIASTQGELWEYRLTAELLRSHLTGPVRDWQDLHDGLIVKEKMLLSEQALFPWISSKMSEASDIIISLTKLYAERLPISWGEPGVPGDAEEMLHIAKRIGDVAQAMVAWEESVRFVRVPDVARELVSLFQGAVGRNLEKLAAVPAEMDQDLDNVEANPDDKHVLNYTLVFDLPEGWPEQVSAEISYVSTQIEQTF